MRLEDLYNLHKDKIGFVIGAGPSLRNQDLTNLKNHISICVNSGIMKYSECNYFISDDIAVANWTYYYEEVAKSKCIKLLYEDKLKDKISHLKKEEVILFKHKTWYDLKNKKYYPEGLVLTKDPNLPIVGARTSAGSAVHFLYIMGCNPIVLLGCDSCYDNKIRYFWQYPEYKKPKLLNGKNVYSTPDKGNINGKLLDTHCVEFQEYWKAFNDANKDKIKIYYASDNGSIDCFEKIKLENILK